MAGAAPLVGSVIGEGQFLPYIQLSVLSYKLRSDSPSPNAYFTTRQGDYSHLHIAVDAYPIVPSYQISTVFPKIYKSTFMIAFC